MDMKHRGCLLKRKLDSKEFERPATEAELMYLDTLKEIASDKTADSSARVYACELLLHLSMFREYPFETGKA